MPVPAGNEQLRIALGRITQQAGGYRLTTLGSVDDIDAQVVPRQMRADVSVCEFALSVLGGIDSYHVQGDAVTQQTKRIVQRTDRFARGTPGERRTPSSGG